ncbi:MAG TPA: glycosyltransferase [Thermoleophilaceae bacterium]|nr:glycosyltransferase [Thermoleophilaceae bacterium]
MGCVVLTACRSEQDLERAVASLGAQTEVELEIAVVGNGCSPPDLPPGVSVVALPEDVGIPGGRNAGVEEVGGDLLFFLDDDASLADTDTLARVAERFDAEPDLGLLQLRVDPLDGGPPLRNWVPRLRVGDRARSSDVTSVWEGAVAIRRSLFDTVGGWPAEFRFVHEGTDLAWRVLDAGYRVSYAGDLVALHPSHRVFRHAYSYYYGARNRVWLARRYLPGVLGVAFVASFVLRTLPNMRSADSARAAFRGYRDGMRQPAGRQRLRTETLWRMTKLGRPPVI